MKNIEEIAALLIDQRKKLGIEQKYMYMRICIKHQASSIKQHQRIEVGSDVILSLLLRVLAWLELELSIVPRGGTATASLVESVSDSQSEFGNGTGEREDDSDDLGFWFNSEDNS
ncbi:helix-turn-helix domain-containing protein [Plesiomonas sp.]|uniref:helix-turn-helix domain-containing protein n=1 Tax=Plesiomonas sp. TaxID=2486279 RepID=UPI003F37F2FC